MKQTLLALVLILSFTTAHATSDCEGSATAWPTHLITLVKRSLEVQALKLSDLESLTGTDKLVSPFENKPASPENLDLRRTLERAMGHIRSEKDRAAVRIGIAELIRAAENSQHHVEQAQLETKNVFAPKVLTPFGIQWTPGIHHSTIDDWEKIVQGNFEGRPVFLSGFEDSRVTTAHVYPLIMLDPFHPDSSQRKRVIAVSQSKEQLGAFGFIERDNKTYVQLLNPLRTFDLATLEEVTLEENPNLPFTEFKIGERKLLARVLPDKSIVIRESGKPDWIYENTTGRRRFDLTLFAIDGRTYLGFSEWALNKKDDPGREGELFRVDLETKETLRTSQLSPPYEFEHWQDMHHAHAFTPERSYLVTPKLVQWNWRTMSGEPLWTTRGMVHYFNYDEREYILMGWSFMNAETRSELFRVQIPGNNKFVNFTHNGQHYALGVNYDSYPILIQFTDATY